MISAVAIAMLHEARDYDAYMRAVWALWEIRRIINGFVTPN